MRGELHEVESSYLELVLAGLSGGRRVEEVNCENLSRQHHVSF
jgi:hypothetical protein